MKKYEVSREIYNPCAEVYIFDNNFFREIETDNIEKTISELFEILGDRKIVIARELTKKYEQYIRTSLRSLSEDFSMLEHRGEMVIILEGAIEEVEPEINKEAVEKRIKELLLQDLSTKEVAKQIAIEYKIKKNDAYALALGIK